MQKYLGIDYGDKRVGLALAVENSIALPYKVLLNKNLHQLLQDLELIIKQENISLIVVGLPHSLSGQLNQRLAITQQFVDMLRSKISVSVITVDEQMSSKLYERQGVKKDIDKHAATAILDTYLTQRHV